VAPAIISFQWRHDWGLGPSNLLIFLAMAFQRELRLEGFSTGEYVFFGVLFFIPDNISVYFLLAYICVCITMHLAFLGLKINKIAPEKKKKRRKK